MSYKFYKWIERTKLHVITCNSQNMIGSKVPLDIIAMFFNYNRDYNKDKNPLPYIRGEDIKSYFEQEAFEIYNKTKKETIVYYINPKKTNENTLKFGSIVIEFVLKRTPNGYELKDECFVGKANDICITFDDDGIAKSIYPIPELRAEINKMFDDLVVEDCELNISIVYKNSA